MKSVSVTSMQRTVSPMNKHVFIFSTFVFLSGYFREIQQLNISRATTSYFEDSY